MLLNNVLPKFRIKGVTHPSEINVVESNISPQRMFTAPIGFSDEALGRPPEERSNYSKNGSDTSKPLGVPDYFSIGFRFFLGLGFFCLGLYLGATGGHYLNKDRGILSALCLISGCLLGLIGFYIGTY